MPSRRGRSVTTALKNLIDADPTVVEKSRNPLCNPLGWRKTARPFLADTKSRIVVLDIR